MWLILGFLLLLATPSLARDPMEVRHFRAEHACPSTGKFKGPCKGYVVDHIVPLCAHGADDPSNMQWQELAVSHEKDKVEWALCRWIAKGQK